MVAERELAAKLGIEDPINCSIEKTHDRYNDALTYLAENQIHAVVATHNRESVAHMMAKMKELGIKKKGIFAFAQVFNSLS
jgi:cation transport regulator ChaC